MIQLLSKIFIKNYKEYNNQNVRAKYGILCGAYGVFLNVCLFIVKFIFGTIANSIAMVADSINNLSDAASSFISVIGFKLSSKKADKEHPFGHGRIEYIAGLIISFFIILMGFELFKSSIESIINPKEIQSNIFSIIVMVLSIGVKFYMYLYNHSIGKKINSVSMEATAKDSLSDMISTSIVIISLISSKFTNFPIDSIAGIIVAIFILYAGFESVKETIQPLLGMKASPEIVEQIEQEVMKHKPIVGIHDLIIHDYGPGRLMISLHAEVPGDGDIFELHDVIDNAEFAIAKKLDCHVVIHMDPIDTKNPRLVELKQCIKKELQEIDSELSFHDVRMVPGQSHTNLIFDIVKNHCCKLKDEELKLDIQNRISKNNPDVCCVITIDNPYC